MENPQINFPISISTFSSNVNLLNTELWEKQSEILEDFWAKNYTVAIWALGRRSGKTLMAAVTACYAACMLADAYKSYLRLGEKFYIVSIANTIDQAKIALQNVKTLINSSPILAPMIIRETSDTLELSNGAVFRAMPTSSRGGRGLPIPLLIFDELAHAVDTEGNASGSSLYQALSPSVAQFGNLGRILMLSSPWIQNGIFWELFRQANSGTFPHMQAVQCPTWEVNPTISEDFLEQERARDPDLFSVEYGANFSQSLSSLVTNELVDAAINYDRSFLPPQSKFIKGYYLSLDPARGNRDQYTACISHYDEDTLVIDKWHVFKATVGEGKKKQVSISEVENWILEQHQLYSFAEIVLDQFNSSSTIQRLSGRLNIHELTWTSTSKTQAFTRLRELFNGGNIELYPHVANHQIKNLSVIYRANGQWSVSGGSGVAVDDYASCLAACALIAKKRQRICTPASLRDALPWNYYESHRDLEPQHDDERLSSRELRELF